MYEEKILLQDAGDDMGGMPMGTDGDEEEESTDTMGESMDDLGGDNDDEEEGTEDMGTDGDDNMGDM